VASVSLRNVRKSFGHVHVLSGIDLEIAASWRQTQQLLDARIRDGAFGENDNGAGVLSELGADASAPYKALGRISDQRLPQFAGLEEGLKFLSA